MNLWFDLKYAWRLLFKSPGHSALCIVVVALSVSAALFAYSFYYSMALKPLGFPGSEHWYSVQLAADSKATAWPAVDAFTYQEIRHRTHSVNYVGAFSNRAVILSEGEASTRLRAAAISPSLLSATKVQPYLGRLFGEADEQPGTAPAVILSYAAWQSYFAGDRSVIGKQTRVDSRPVQVVGVMPKEFFGFEDHEIWMPLHTPIIAQPTDSEMVLAPFIIADSRRSRDSALSELQLVVDDVNKLYPRVFNAERRVELIDAHRWGTHSAQPLMAMLLFLGLAVAFLGSINISMVFLARLLERSRELALRTALGASQSRILRQCLLETVFVVVLGLIAAYGLTALSIRWIQDLVLSSTQIAASGRWLGAPDFGFGDVAVAIVLASIIWLISTLLPARRIAKQDAVIALSGSGKGAVGARSGAGIRTLVAVQVLTSSLILAICANLAMATRAELGKPSGIATTNLMVSTFPTTFDARYTQAADRLRYLDELTAASMARLRDAEIAYATAVPAFPVSVPVSIETQDANHSAAGPETQTLPLTSVSSNYFSLMGVTLRAGRLFDSSDEESGALNIIVDENIAARYWPGANATKDVLGKRLQLDPANKGPWLTIVGVVSHARQVDPMSFGRDRDSGFIYRPLRAVAPPSFHLLAKSPASIDSRPALRAAAFAVDRDLPLHNLQRYDDYRAAFDGMFVSIVYMFSAIAAITAVLAATGLFGLISRSVAQRTREVGVRRALGATRSQVTVGFLREGAVYLVLGIIGIGGGVIVTIGTGFPNVVDQVLSVTFAVLILMTLVILCASYLPTRRAVALEPGDALRYE